MPHRLHNAKGGMAGMPVAIRVKRAPTTAAESLALASIAEVTMVVDGCFLMLPLLLVAGFEACRHEAC
jgi:hypothetical protein